MALLCPRGLLRLMVLHYFQYISWYFCLADDSRAQSLETGRSIECIPAELSRFILLGLAWWGSPPVLEELLIARGQTACRLELLPTTTGRRSSMAVAVQVN
jgi:hypothetical protein